MRRVALIYNPVAGQRPERRAALIAEVLTVLRQAGVEVQAIATESPESAGTQAQEAMQAGYDTILACGGDGTVHEALQKLVGGTAALGVIPMGTANALATDLGLSSSPVKAARMLLTAAPERVSVGRVFYRDGNGKACSRYFIVAAGIGADALFFSRLDSQLKQRFGYAVYVVEAFRLWARYKYPMFAASFVESGKEAARAEEVSQLLAVRIGNFGGAVGNLAPGAGRGNHNLHVLAFKTRSSLRYLRFMVSALCGRPAYSETIELVDCTSVECRELEGSKTPSFVEADGEWLGTLPVRMEVVPDALTVLVPQRTMGRGGNASEHDRRREECGQAQ
jgi:diacylglycerol kinase (ATP)